jgi:RNA polymerase sigma factor (sigma-70 family)
VAGRKLGQQVARLEALLAKDADRHAPEAAAALTAKQGPTDEPTTGEVERAISRLPEREKLVITLLYSERLTREEIAEVRGVSPVIVENLHMNALKRLSLLALIRKPGHTEAIP